MTLQINGQRTLLEEGTSIAEYMRIKSITPETVVVEQNYVIVPREKWEETFFAENDIVEILKFVGGGAA